jgi:tripartite-type tricarboxylate transporter receptor subunit TctC
MGIIPHGAEDFEHIITFNTDPGGIWVNTNAPWQTLNELVEHARNNPDQVSVAASTPGSITRFQLLALEQNADVTFLIISQQGGAANGLLQLAGGHLDVAMGTPLEGYALYQAGRIRPLGFYADTRVPMMSDIPTLQEHGFPIVLATTRTVIAPKNTPKEIIDTLYEAFSKVVSNEKFIADMESKGSTVLNLNPEQTKDFLRQQDIDFIEIIKSVDLYKPQ